METNKEQTEPDPRAARFARRLEKMVAGGRITPAEAERLRTSDGPEADELIAGIRARHIGSRLDDAVANGDMSRAEADDMLRQAKDQPHSRRLGAHLARVRLSRASGRRQRRG